VCLEPSGNGLDPTQPRSRIAWWTPRDDQTLTA
jgi:hypothetical protein